MLKQIDETATNITWKYFIEKDYDVFLASYLSVEYTTPDAIGLTVDGHSTAPLINYIQDATPDLSWTLGDSGTGEYQRDYALEVNSNQYFNGTELWSVNHTNIATVYESAGSTNIRPFGTDEELRFQMKYDTSLVTTSGVVDKLHFALTESTGTLVFENFVIMMVCTIVAGDLTADFAANYGSAIPVVVLNRSSYSVPIIDNSIAIDIENTFFINARHNLIIELRFTNNTGELSTALQTTGVGGSVAYTVGTGAYLSTTADFLYARAHSLKVEMMSDEVYNTPGSSSANHFPFDTDDGHPGIFQMKYNQSLINNTGIIDRIFFSVNTLFGTGDVVFEGLKVYLAETPVLGPLNHTDFASNYGGVTPTLVLDEELCTLRNIGDVLVIDIDNVFTYRGNRDLLVELKWDNKVSGTSITYRTINGGAYRAWNITYGSPTNSNDDLSYDMILDFVHSDTNIEYAGTPLVNTTGYYWRVKTCDSTGIWSDWASSSFTYMKLDSVPEYSAPVVSPSPAYAESLVSVSLNVTYFLGIYGAWIELGGTNHSMTADGDTYTYTWTPTTAGNYSFVIYMESNIETWSSTSGFVDVLTPSIFPIDTNTLLIIVGAVAVVVIIIVIMMKKRGEK